MWLPSSESRFNKWTVEKGELQGSISAVYTLFYQIALRNKLGERMDTGILRVPVVIDGGKIRALTHAEREQISKVYASPLEPPELSTLMKQVVPGYLKVKQYAESFRGDLISSLFEDNTAKLNADLQDEILKQRALFTERKQSLDQYSDQKHVKRLRAELEQAVEKMKQLTFDPEINLENRLRVDDLKADIEFQRQSNHVAILKERLEKEEERVIQRVLPRRYALEEEGVEVMPVAVHILVSSREVA